jgi:hypothetical protein
VVFANERSADEETLRSAASSVNTPVLEVLRLRAAVHRGAAEVGPATSASPGSCRSWPRRRGRRAPTARATSSAATGPTRSALGGEASSAGACTATSACSPSSASRFPDAAEALGDVRRRPPATSRWPTASAAVGHGEAVRLRGGAGRERRGDVSPPRGQRRRGARIRRPGAEGRGGRVRLRHRRTVDGSCAPRGALGARPVRARCSGARGGPLTDHADRAREVTRRRTGKPWGTSRRASSEADA